MSANQPMNPAGLTCSTFRKAPCAGGSLARVRLGS